MYLYINHTHTTQKQDYSGRKGRCTLTARNNEYDNDVTVNIDKQ